MVPHVHNRVQLRVQHLEPIFFRRQENLLSLKCIELLDKRFEKQVALVRPRWKFRVNSYAHYLTIADVLMKSRDLLVLLVIKQKRCTRGMFENRASVVKRVVHVVLSIEDVDNPTIARFAVVELLPQQC